MDAIAIQKEKINAHFTIAIMEKPQFTNVFLSIKDYLEDSYIGYRPRKKEALFTGVLKHLVNNVYYYAIKDLINEFNYTEKQLNFYNNLLGSSEKLSKEEEIKLDDFFQNLSLVEGNF